MGFFEDSLGRKFTLLLGLALNTFGCFVGGLCKNLITLCILLFFGGVGIGAILSSLVALASESCPPSQRGFYATFVASFWSVGSLYVALVGFLVLGVWEGSWRVFLILCSIPPAVGWVMCFFLVPESARFLALHGHYEEATRSANLLASKMGYNPGEQQGAGRGDSWLTVEELRHHFARGHAIDPHNAVGPSTREATKNISTLYSPSLRWTTLTVQAFWIFLSFSSALFTWTNTILQSVHTSVYFDAFLGAISGLAGQMIGSILVDRIGRKPLFTGCLFLAAVTLAYFAFVADEVGKHPEALAFAVCLYSAILACGWSTLYVISAEVFPTKVRGSGNGLCAATGRSANILSQFINGALIHNPPALLTLTSAIVFVGWLFSCVSKLEDMGNRPLVDEVVLSGQGGDEDDYDDEDDREEDGGVQSGPSLSGMTRQQQHSLI